MKIFKRKDGNLATDALNRLLVYLPITLSSMPQKIVSYTKSIFTTASSYGYSI